MDDLLDIATVARHLGVSERTVYNRVRAGDLPALKIGRLWRVRARDLERWLASSSHTVDQHDTKAGHAAGRRLLERHRGEIEAACIRHHVKRLDAFGSVLRDDFTPESDIDFLVDFLPVDARGFSHPYWSLADELEFIFGRSIDLVMVSAVTNPYLTDELESSRETLYAA
ncbi:MAG: helix-turn-helix domain-containing protein [Coriobacteriia bacterium]|nr:helix-turn-helix domain-containing protein [Coriobacteriia bacterium]